MRLLIVRPGAVGDALLAFPIIRILRARHADVHITLVSNKAVLPLARAAAIVDETSNYDDPHWSELFSHAGIQAPAMHDLLINMDLAICWLRDLNGLVAYNLRASGVKQVIVAAGRPAEDDQMHIVAYLAHTIGMDLVHGDWPRQKVLPEGYGGDLWPPLFAESRETIPHNAYFAVHPGSGGARKCWPVASFASVIRELWLRAIPVLLLAGPADHERLALLLRELPAPPHASLLKKLIDVPLLELAQQLRICRGYLGNDAGVTHLAAMLGLPTVVLFGPSNPAVWRPWGSDVHLLYQPNLADLSVDNAMNTIGSLLSFAPRSRR